MAGYEGAGYEDAGHEGAGHGGIDALLAAITEEALPEGARDDAAFMAEHRSAVADVALLREQLRMMGDTLAGETPAPQAAVTQTPKPLREPEPRREPKPLRPYQPPWYRRYAGLALGTLVVAGGAALVGGMVWLGVQGGADSDGAAGGDSAASKQEAGAGDTSAESPEMHLACSKILVEGTVRSITSTGDGNVRVVLKVKRYYRPEQSAADHPTVTVTLPEEAREDLKTGTYTLVRVPVRPRDRLDYETGWGIRDVRKEIIEALPGARGMECESPEGGEG
ncbi:hypothetical protein [Streptomyces aurantiacus]|uniref:hypothetical protein n=1 Tax=Streptomyces aurantiacus TaxID=47760 RepID=UPI0006E34CAB|nr:hypothetical protein [Streptomyces aurantiacus]